MNWTKLLTVEDAFWIQGGHTGMMLVLSPAFFTRAGTWTGRSENVLVLRPDGRELAGTAEIRFTHLSIRDPEVPSWRRWPITVWLTDCTKEDVPIGSVIMVSREVREAFDAQGIVGENTLTRP